MEYDFEMAENNDQIRKRDEEIEYNKEYILNYDKYNKEDFQTFLQSVSSYNWLKLNKQYIKNSDDLEHILGVSNEILSQIEQIVDSGLNFEIVTGEIRKLLQNNSLINENKMYFEFDISLCDSLGSIKDKISHHRSFLHSIREHSKDNVMQR